MKFTKLLLAVTGLLIITFIFQFCKKSHFSQERDPFERFFHVAGNQPAILKKISQDLRDLEQRSPFLSEIIDTEGFPQWEHSEIIADGIKTRIAIPFLLDGSRSVETYFLYNDSLGHITLHLIRGRTYDSYGFGKGFSANHVAADLMRMNHRVFGDTVFVVNDTRLFGLNRYKEIVSPFLITLASDKSVQTLAVSSNGTTDQGPRATVHSNSLATCSRSITFNGCDLLASDSGPTWCGKITVYYVPGGQCIDPDPIPTPPQGGSQPLGHSGSDGGGGGTISITLPACPVGMSAQDCHDRIVPVLSYLAPEEGTFTQIRSTEREPSIYASMGSEWWNLATNIPGYTYQQKPKPNFFTFVDKYPKNSAGTDEMSVMAVCTLIGGQVLTKYNGNEVKNACALRVSRALNYSGVTIPAIVGQTWTGADGKNYFFRAHHLFNWLSKTLGAADLHLTESQGAPNGTKFAQQLIGLENRGIYIMVPKSVNTFEATGHASFWGGVDVFGGKNYFGAAKDIYIWRLPQ